MGTSNTLFEKLALQHMDAVYSHAIELEPDMQRVEDLVQITYLRAYEQFSLPRRHDDFQNWLLGLLDDIFQKQKNYLSVA